MKKTASKQTAAIDPEDEQPAQAKAEFSFRGKPLAHFGFGHRACMFRLGAAIDAEYAIYLIRILQMTLDEVDAIREEKDISAFRIESGNWADREGITTPKGLEEIMALANSILAEGKE